MRNAVRVTLRRSRRHQTGMAPVEIQPLSGGINHRLFPQWLSTAAPWPARPVSYRWHPKRRCLRIHKWPLVSGCMVNITPSNETSYWIWAHVMYILFDPYTLP